MQLAKRHSSKKLKTSREEINSMRKAAEASSKPKAVSISVSVDESVGGSHSEHQEQVGIIYTAKVCRSTTSGYSSFDVSILLNSESGTK